MPIKEYNYSYDPGGPGLGRINAELRQFTARADDPFTLEKFVGFQAQAHSKTRSIVFRISIQENEFFARTSSPLNGASFSTNAAPSVISIVFNNKINPASLTGNSVRYNGVNLLTSKLTIENDYILNIDISSDGFAAKQTHTVEIISLSDSRNNSLTRQEISSWSVGESSFPDRGNPEPYQANLKQGELRIGEVLLVRQGDVEARLAAFLNDRGVDRNSVIAEAMVGTNEGYLTLYILYFDELFPRLVKSYPQEGSLGSSDSLPTQVVLTYSGPVNHNCMIQDNNITYEGTDVGSATTISEDGLSLFIDISDAVAADPTGVKFLKVKKTYNQFCRDIPGAPIMLQFSFDKVGDSGVAGVGDSNGITGISADGGPTVDGTTYPDIYIDGGDTFITTTGTPSGVSIYFEDPGFITTADLPPVVTGVSADVGADITADTTPLVAVSGGDDFITTSGDSTAGAIVITFDDPGFITDHPVITPVAPDSENEGNTFIQDISFDAFGHVATVASGNVVPGSIDHGALNSASLLDDDHPQYFKSGVFDAVSDTKIVKSDGAGSVTFITDNSTNWDTAYTHISATDNPHNVTASQAGAVDTDTYSSVGIVISDGDGTATINAASGTDIGNWDTAYGWGNHGTIGYLTTHPTVDPSASSTNNSNPDFIQNLTFDSTGHVITVSSVSITPPDIGALDASNVSGPGVIVSTGSDSGVITTGTVNDYVSGIALTGVYIDGTVSVPPGGTGDLNITGFLTTHPAVTPVASDSDNAGNTFIQDISFDVFGHATGIASGLVDLGSISHANLLNLDGDDHGQYLTTGRGDVLYYRESEVDGFISGITDSLASGTGAGIFYVASGDNVSYFANDAEYAATFIELNDTPASVTSGQIFYASGTDLLALGSGVAGHYLQQGAAFPQWAEVTDPPVISVNGEVGEVLLSGSHIEASHVPTSYTATDTTISGHFSGADTEIGVNAQAIANNTADISVVSGLAADKDNYQHWIASDGSTSGTVISQEHLIVSGTNDVTVAYVSGTNTFTINTPVRADTELSYVTTGTEASLGNETVLAAGAGLSLSGATFTASGVELGGVSATLGVANPTPAFDLADATNYPSSGLVGEAAASGAFLYSSGTAWVELPAAASGSFLKTQGLNDAPTWFDITPGSIGAAITAHTHSFVDLDDTATTIDNGEVLYVTGDKVIGLATGESSTGKFLQQGPDGYIRWSEAGGGNVNDLSGNFTGHTGDASIHFTKTSIVFNDLDNVNEASENTGALLFNSGGSWEELAPGSNGLYLKAQGDNSPPIWSSIGLSSNTFVGLTDTPDVSIDDGVIHFGSGSNLIGLDTGESSTGKFLQQGPDGYIRWDTPAGAGSYDHWTISGAGGGVSSNIETTDTINYSGAGNITLTLVSGDPNQLTISGTAGGGGAPTDVSYVTLGTDGDLSAERVLAPGTGMALNDGGVGGNVTLSASGYTVAPGTGLSGGGSANLGESITLNLTNTGVSYGGVEVFLGGSDPTPAFNLEDGTGYPVGQIVGDIPNSQLTNSDITMTQGTGLSIAGSPVALGGTVTLNVSGATTAAPGIVQLQDSATDGTVNRAITPNAVYDISGALSTRLDDTGETLSGIITGLTLNDLANVTAPPVEVEPTGQLLFNSGGEWRTIAAGASDSFLRMDPAGFGAPGGSAPAVPAWKTVGLANLDDVEITSPLTGALLYWDGTNWVDIDPPASVDHVLISTGQAVPYWTGMVEKLTGTSGWLSSGTLEDIGDVQYSNIQVLAPGDLLYYTLNGWRTIPLDSYAETWLPFNALSGVTVDNTDTGSILINSGGTWIELDAANSGYVLETRGTAAMPAWVPAGGSSDVDTLSGNFTGHTGDAGIHFTSIAGLADVAGDDPANSEVLTWHEASGVWYPASTFGGGGGATALDELDDVTLASHLHGQLLTYDTSTTQWINASPRYFQGFNVSENFFDISDNKVCIYYDNGFSTGIYQYDGAGNTSQQSVYTDILNPETRYSINSIDLYLGRNYADSAYYDKLSYKIYPIEVTGGIHTTGTFISSGEVDFSINSQSHIYYKSSPIVNPITGDNIYLQFVLETGHASTTLFNYTNMQPGFGRISYLRFEVGTNYVSSANSPFGSASNMPASYQAGNLSDVFFDKTITGDQTISGSLIIPAGKTLTVTKTPGSTLDAANKTYVDDLGDTKAALVDFNAHAASGTVHFTEGSIDHTAITNIGSNTHAQIDTHVGSKTNPHNTDIGNLGAGTLAELNTAVTDATLDDSSASRPPKGSAGGDLSGTYPNPTVNDGADGAAIHDNVVAEISSLTEKVTPVSADLIIIEDSAALHSKKKVQIGNLPSGGGGSSDLTPAEAFAWFVS